MVFIQESAVLKITVFDKDYTGFNDKDFVDYLEVPIPLIAGHLGPHGFVAQGTRERDVTRSVNNLIQLNLNQLRSN